MLFGGLSAPSASNSIGYLPANRETAGGRWGWSVEYMGNEWGLLEREVLFEGPVWPHNLGAYP